MSFVKWWARSTKSTYLFVGNISDTCFPMFVDLQVDIFFISFIEGATDYGIYVLYYVFISVFVWCIFYPEKSMNLWTTMVLKFNMMEACC